MPPRDTPTPPRPRDLTVDAGAPLVKSLAGRPPRHAWWWRSERPSRERCPWDARQHAGTQAGNGGPNGLSDRRCGTAAPVPRRPGSQPANEAAEMSRCAPRAAVYSGAFRPGVPLDPTIAMSDDDFEEPDEIDDDGLEQFDADEDIDEDDLVDVDEEDAVDDPEVEIVDADDTTSEDEDEVAVPVVEDDEDVVDLDEELHPDDVEEALDVVLRERTAKVGLEDDEEDDEPDDRGDSGTKIVPRRPGEFVCSSCFLVLPRHMLADEKASLCRDCA